MSNNAIIDQIIANADIVKIIGKHVELKRSGNEFKGCCPFHGEKTPSFFVNPQKGLYNCFGCGVAGNALTFLKEYENLTAGEALKELSRQTGIELPKEPVNKSHTYKKTPVPPKPAVSQASASLHQNLAQSPVQTLSDSDVAERPSIDDAEALWIDAFDDFQTSDNLAASFIPFGEYDDASVGGFSPFDDLGNSSPQDSSSSLYDLLTQICQFYQHQLQQNSFAQHYLLKRGLTPHTIEEFALGFAPNGWQHLEEAFPQDIEGLKILGLVRTSQHGRDFDLLRNRVIFPIRDQQGRVIGFAGRTLSDDEQPKYINSSDSPVFHKQAVLYGLFEGRKAKAKNWLVVEGYMDVISLHQAGVYGAVASMGTALAQSQIERLLQFNPILTLSFDGDSAGQKAAWRAMEVGLPALTDGKELHFLTLPDNHDPDSYVKAHGLLAMQQQIAQAVPLSAYLYSSLTRQYPTNTPENRSKILQQLSALTQKLPKGSYGWLLREDIKNKMGLGRKNQARQAQDALLNFDSELTVQLHLQLCFLFQPELLGSLENNRISQSVIRDIYQRSEAANVFKPKHPSTKPTTPIRLDENSTGDADVINGVITDVITDAMNAPCRNYDESCCLTWQAIADEELLKLITWIQTIQSRLQDFDNPKWSTYDRINAKAHFILAGLTSEQQNKLIKHWARFFKELSQRNIDDISDLVTELVVQLMLESLQRQQKTLKADLKALSLCIKHHQAILTWLRTWLQRKED